MKYNEATLKKMEGILEDAGYVIRYERGSFQSGYCILEARKVAVLNKFLTTEGRINTLTELIPTITINYEMLTSESQKMYDAVIKETETEQKQSAE